MLASDLGWGSEWTSMALCNKQRPHRNQSIEPEEDYQLILLL
jgi:hypothetical protein